MKTGNQILVIIGVIIVANLAFARGGDISGGGDLCEDRIQVIRDDITSWIHQGGPDGLALTRDLSVQQYSRQMLDQISITKIRCVGPNDEGFPVTINGTPKVCRFDRTENSSQITCDFSKFNSMDPSDQYVLVHHEFAGLAGIELPNEDDSHYVVSNQISGYLETQKVKKLVVHRSQDAAPYPEEMTQSVSSKDPKVLAFSKALNGRTLVCASAQQQIPFPILIKAEQKNDEVTISLTTHSSSYFSDYLEVDASTNLITFVGLGDDTTLLTILQRDDYTDSAGTSGTYSFNRNDGVMDSSEPVQCDVK